MRSAFAQEITDLASSDDRVIVLSGDIGNQMFDDYQEKFPAGLSIAVSQRLIW